MRIIFLIIIPVSVLVPDLKIMFLYMRLLLNSLGNPNFDYRLPWNTIPAILAKEKKKYQYKEVNPKARSSTYRTVIEWLEKSGLIHLAYTLKTPQLPLSGYKDPSKFKIYFHDIGLLSAMLDVKPKIILEKEALFSIYNGAFVENFTACELLRSGESCLHY